MVCVCLGTIRIPDSTQNLQYVKHMILSRVGGGHFSYWNVRQQVLTKMFLVKISASSSSFVDIWRQFDILHPRPYFWKGDFTKHKVVRLKCLENIFRRLFKNHIFSKKLFFSGKNRPNAYTKKKLFGKNMIFENASENFF